MSKDTKPKTKPKPNANPDAVEPLGELTTTIISRKLLRQVRTIGHDKNETNAEVLDRVGGPAIQSEYRKILEDRLAATASSSED